MTGGRRAIRWAAWHVEADGSVRAMLVVDGEAGPEREEVRFSSLEEAVERLGDSFGDVVERAVSAGHRRGRWRP